MKRWIIGAAALAVVVGGPAWAAPSYPLHVAAGSHSIIDQQGKPIFFNADSPWHLIARLTREDATLYLDDRKAKGFNTLLLSLIVSVGYSTGSSNNAYGAPPFLTPGNFATPNEAYFAHADWVLEQANLRGFTVFLAPAYIGFNCNNSGWCAQMKQNGTTAMRAYGRWVGSRYANQPNIIWVHGGDADASAFGALAVVDAVALGIRDTDPNHLHTAHCQRFSSALDCYDRPWLDFNTTYADCIQSPLQLRTDYQRSPARPFVLIEGQYEFESGWTPACIRSQAYWSLLGGAVGQFFGVGPIWDFTSSWDTVLDSQGTQAMAAFGRLLRSRRWDLLVPDYSHTALTAGYGNVDTADYAPAARTTDGNTLLVYTPVRRSLRIDMGRISGNAAKVWWYDPADGSNQLVGSLPNSGPRDFMPPSAQDWVLVIDNATADMAPPGEGETGAPSSTRSWGSFKDALSGNR
jgi:hypothetical protein